MLPEDYNNAYLSFSINRIFQILSEHEVTKIMEN